MNQKLQRLYDLAEKERKKILESLAAVSQEKLMWHDENRWSISQILTHLILAEQLSLSYMKKKSLGVDQLDNSGLVEEIKSLILTISQRLPLKYKAPKVLAESSPQALPLPEIEVRWTNVRQELRSFLNSIDEKNLRKKIYKHPFAGRLNVLQAMSFTREHVNHHLPQIKRLCKKSGDYMNTNF